MYKRRPSRSSDGQTAAFGRSLLERDTQPERPSLLPQPLGCSAEGPGRQSPAALPFDKALSGLDACDGGEQSPALGLPGVSISRHLGSFQTCQTCSLAQADDGGTSKSSRCDVAPRPRVTRSLEKPRFGSAAQYGAALPAPGSCGGFAFTQPPLSTGSATLRAPSHGGLPGFCSMCRGI